MNDFQPQTGKQLSFDVEQYPHLVGEKPLMASVKIGVDLGVREDLNPGDNLVVIIQDADGQVIASGDAAVVGVGFNQIKESGDVIGVHRQHKAKLVD